MKFVQTSYLGTKNILRFADHFVNMPVMVADTGVTVNDDGKKLVPAGTIIGGSGGKVLEDPENILVVASNDENAEGVLFNDVDVTYGPAPGAMLIHGFPATDKLPVVPAATAITALAGRIVFLK
ncbi:hypothetical protein HSX37_16200|uniref:Bacteriophage lambda head decoration protein D n=1 Tax=Dendrosporobacter quercicolus TaxID=146817 RepID=A0A1G9ZQG5_9FIRM|nr:hypothetical protein [Dendrosporobacter quercicolus]NSL49578.1 hypothetical protein [Dendrosporobacter quercicolus DSM 1736]SDN23460.1 hypothetical protein SAMN04488502_11534 [Dendrosporobacter quercicolus]